jgi:hypothetical protein
MKDIILIIISIGLVCLGILIQIRMLNKHHPNAELLIRILRGLGIHMDASTKWDNSNGKD